MCNPTRRPSRLVPTVVVRHGERYRAVCQDEGLEQGDHQGNRSKTWTKIKYAPGRFGYINEIWFGFHERLLAPCPPPAG